MATVVIRTSPIGSQLVETISGNEPDDLNDFEAFFNWDENASDFTQSDITLSAGASIVSFEGSNSAYRAVIRPPETAGTLRISIAADVVSAGNPATSLDVRLSTSFPDADAEVPTQLFTISSDNVWGITISPTRILTLRRNRIVQVFTHAGVVQTGEQINIGGTADTQKIDYINNEIIIYFIGGAGRYDLSGNRLINYGTSLSGATHTAYGILSSPGSGIITMLPYGETGTSEKNPVNTDITVSSISDFAHQDGLLVFYGQITAGNYRYGIAELTAADNIDFIKLLNIGGASGSNVRSLAIYGDTLYILSASSSTSRVHTLNIRPYRPLAKNTKTTIPVQFADEGDTIDLTQYCPDAHTIIFDVGMDLPDHLSINSNNELVIDSNAVTETTPVLVRLRGINYIDSAPFSFYLVIEQAAAPTWRDVESLSMKANTRYDLHQIVDADSISLQSGPTGSSISDGVFTIATTGGDATFRATKDGLTTDKTIQIDVIQLPDISNFSDITRYKVEIGGIDVSADLLKDAQPRISKSLDDVELTRYRAHSVTVSLDDTDGKYSPDLAGNFWETNNLNPGGYQEAVKVYRESYINDAWVESLLFVGIIESQAEQFSTVQVNITAKDISVELERSFISDFGTLLKWLSLRQQSDEATFEGVYVPEGQLPIQPEVAKAWTDRTELTLRRLQLPTKGPPLSNTGYLTASDLRTSGGFLENPPILNAKTLPRSEDATFLFNQLALTESVYNTDIQLPAVELDAPTVFNRGSVPFSVERTRITRLPVDWVHDTTNERVLILLSNPEGHIADLLVQYNLNTDSYRTLYTFDKDVKAHRIARRTSTDYYILTSGEITQDRSAATLLRGVDSTGYAYDSVAEGSVIRIHRYNASTNTLTEHVAEDNARPPQLGIHIHAGFENTQYIDFFEGIAKDYRGAFKIHSDNLYYRYAIDAEFGVARVNTAGTTTEMIDQARGNYHDHLNFAFDANGSGDIYFVYATGDADESSLVIKRRTSGGTESTILTDTKDLDDLTALDSNGGAYLGCYEALFHNNFLYMLVPIQRVDEDSGTYTRSREKSAGMCLYRCNVTAGSPSLTVIETYPYVQRGACDLIVHDGSVHFIENTPALTQFRPINPDLDGYWTDAAETQTLGYNTVSESLGALKKINSSGDVESLGTLWYDERPFNVAGGRALSFDDELHVMMGYGNPNEVLRYNSLASKADNFVHLVFGNKLKYIVPEFQADGNIYSKVAELARMVGATVSFDGNIISVVDRRPFRAKTDGGTGTGTGNLDFDSENKDFPTSGYLRIGDEFIGYTGISSGAFTGITRGALGSEPTDHSDETDILYVNALFSEREILTINASTDTTRHHNIIRDSENAFKAKDDTNISQYRQQPYTLDLGLTRNEDAWTETIFAEYLSELKNLGKVITLRLRRGKKAFALDLGQLIGVRHDAIVYVLRIEMIDYHLGRIEIKGRTVA